MKKYKISDLHDNYDLIPATKGMFFIEIPPNFTVEILNITTGKKVYKNKNVLYSANKLNKKYKSTDHHILYIGQTDCLQVTLKRYIKWGYNEPSRAYAEGKAIWQIKNNKQLLIYWKKTDTPKQDEEIKLNEYKKRYGVFPFANWRI